jgi:hypothetical protein
MKLHIALNGNDIEMYHLTALDGILNALMKPATYKKAVTNENAAVDGTMILSAPSVRKADKRTISIPFLLRSVSLVDLQQELDNLAAVLVAGKDNTGINELYVYELNRCYRLYYDSMSSYANFGLDGYARVTLKFTEINPTNNKL